MDLLGFLNTRWYMLEMKILSVPFLFELISLQLDKQKKKAEETRPSRVAPMDI